MYIGDVSVRAGLNRRNDFKAKQVLCFRKEVFFQIPCDNTFGPVESMYYFKCITAFLLQREEIIFHNLHAKGIICVCLPHIST